MKIVVFKEFIGQKIKSFEISEFEEELIFELENGKKYKFFHQQECCESVYIEDISGNLEHIIGMMNFRQTNKNKHVTRFIIACC